ncbi:hypothetical protein [Streptosporangium fragile]
MIRAPKRATQTRGPQKGTANRPSGKTVVRKRRRGPGRDPEPKQAHEPEAEAAGAPERRWDETTVGVLLCLLIPGALLTWLVVTIVSVTMPELRLALGHTGTPGTATVLSCERLTGKGRYDCNAYFVFDDRSKEPIVIDTVPDAEAGEVFRAALTPEGDRVLPTGARGTWRGIVQLDIIPFALALIAFFGALITRSRKVIIWTGALGAPFLVVMIIGIVIGT